MKEKIQFPSSCRTDRESVQNSTLKFPSKIVKIIPNFSHSSKVHTDGQALTHSGKTQIGKNSRALLLRARRAADNGLGLADTWRRQLTSRGASSPSDFSPPSWRHRLTSARLAPQRLATLGPPPQPPGHLIESKTFLTIFDLLDSKHWHDRGHFSSLLTNNVHGLGICFFEFSHRILKMEKYREFSFTYYLIFISRDFMRIFSNLIFFDCASRICLFCTAGRGLAQGKFFYKPQQFDTIIDKFLKIFNFLIFSPFFPSLCSIVVPSCRACTAAPQMAHAARGGNRRRG